MKRIAQLVITIVTFLVSAFILNILAGLMIGNNLLGINIPGMALLGNFPGQAQTTYLSGYFGFMTQDTLGWFTYLTLSSTQDLQILAGGVGIVGGILTFGTFSTGPNGLIPVIMEYGAHVPPLLTVFLPALAWLLLLVGPFLITGIIAGAVAKTKKEAMGNMFLSIIIIAIAGIVLNIFHVYMNFDLSVTWKFSATITQNPVYAYLLGQYGMLTPSEIWYIISLSIVALVFAVINGLVFSIESVIVARKK